MFKLHCMTRNPDKMCDRCLISSTRKEAMRQGWSWPPYTGPNIPEAVPCNTCKQACGWYTCPCDRKKAAIKGKEEKHV